MKYLCAYGNCTMEKESKDMIVLTLYSSGSRLRFCSKIHLKLWVNENITQSL